jgi:hypothetical protein
VWEVIDTSCPVPFLVNETGAIFNASLLGSQVVTHANGSVNCAGGLNLPPGVTLTPNPLLALAKAI